MPERRGGRPPHPDLLTPAELRVLEELRKGGTNAEIAVRIGIGPETVKTHISNMLAKLDLEDRHELAAWREEDAPKRRRWLPLLIPVPGKPLAVFGVVAGVAVAIVVILLLLALVRGEQEALYVEGVGEIEGPVAIFLVEDIVDMTESEKAELAAELGMDHGHETRYRFRAAALDLATGERWFLQGISDDLALAGTRLVAWTDDRIQLVALDGEVEAVLFQSDRTFSDPIVSPDGSKIAFTVDRTHPHDADSVVVLDLQSGDEILRIEAGDPRIGVPDARLRALGELEIVRWSADGTAVWAFSRVVPSRGIHLILGLDGGVHVLREESGDIVTFSPDLRHAISGARVDMGTGSITVTELSTGRALLTLTPEDGHTLAHVSGPYSGQYVYATFPLDTSDQVFTEQEMVPGVLVNLMALAEVLVVRIVDLATGETTVVSTMDEAVLAQIELAILREQNIAHLAYLDRCYESVSALDACDSVVEAYRAVRSTRDHSTELRWELQGFIWLD